MANLRLQIKELEVSPIRENGFLFPSPLAGEGKGEGYAAPSPPSPQSSPIKGEEVFANDLMITSSSDIGFAGE